MPLRVVSPVDKGFEKKKQIGKTAKIKELV